MNDRSGTFPRLCMNACDFMRYFTPLLRAPFELLRLQEHNHKSLIVAWTNPNKKFMRTTPPLPYPTLNHPSSYTLGNTIN